MAYRVVVGIFPDPSDIVRTVQVIRTLMQSGMGGGYVRRFEPLTLVIFGHAAFALLEIASRLNSLSNRDAMRAAVATTILVWFTYFANRPQLEYLMVFCPLYGILLLDTWRVITSPIWRKAGYATDSLLLPAAMMTFGLVILPSTYERYSDLYENKGFSLGTTVGRLKKGLSVDGVILNDTPHIRRLLERAVYLRDHSNRETSLFLSMDSFLMPRLAGYWPKTGIYDPFMGTAMAPYYRQFEASLSQPSIDTIYLDQDSLAEQLVEPVNSVQLSWKDGSRWLFHHLREEVKKHYELVAAESGWEVWKRRAVSESTDQQDAQ